MIEINNLTNFSVDKKIFSTVAKKVLSGENRKTETLSLAFVDKEEIKKLNKKFRKKNQPTDVLSFGENYKSQIPNSTSNYLGEIIICPEVVIENSKKYGVPVKKEMLKMFVHGILHLCGYDHERSKKQAEKMEKKEDSYLTEIK
jgi:rRNA maturation RNase YbeY